MSSPNVEVLLKACCTSTGEGPHWDIATQSLWYVDIDNGDIHCWDSATNKDSQIHLDGTVGFVIPRDKGGLIVGLNRTISTVDISTHKVEILAEVEQGTTNRFNDGKCDASGRLWAGTMGHLESIETFKLGQGSLYSLSTDLTLNKHTSNVDISNGLAWTDDNKTIFYIDSIPKKVFAYDYNIGNGDISNVRVAVDFDKEGIAGLPDGMCIDCQGMLWVACYSGSQVVRLDPETGKCLQTVKLPTTDITSVCFGGKNLDELFVTCNAGGKSDDPLAGSIFRVTNLGVKGKAPTNFKG